MNFEQAKELSKKLNSSYTESGKAIKEYQSSLGHIAGKPVSDSIRSIPEWKILKQTFDKAFQELRTFNSWYVKQFAKELREERNKKFNNI